MRERSGFTMTERLIATGAVTAATVGLLFPLGWLVVSYTAWFAAGLWGTLFVVLCLIDR